MSNIMSTFKITAFFILPLFIIYLAEEVTGVVDPVSQFCTDPDYDIAHSEYVGDILGTLYHKVLASGWGSTRYVYKDPDPYFLYGMVLCRGDITIDVCTTCVIETTNVVRERCLYSNQAIAYYDECMLAYRDVNSYHASDDGIVICGWSKAVPSDPPTYANVVQSLLTELASLASNAPNLYAASSLYGVYGYVQCSMDLSGGDCKSCVEGLISQLPGSCANGFVGGRLIAWTCFLRFENYSFIN